ncbi:MAG TPA: L,D-transpeptidase family protein [Sphingomicrobium sp.]|nr:L,D-transpeptidase family protein [Sphingomicrobium sp.]
MKLIRASLSAAAAVALGTAFLGIAPRPAESVAARPVVSDQAAAIAAFYRSRGGAPLWFSPRSGAAPQQLIQLLTTASAENLDPRRYDTRTLARLVGAAQRGDPNAIREAEARLSQAFVTYVRDQKHDPRVGVIYVDQELKPTPPSAATILGQAAAAPSLADYVQKMGWMNPIYANLRLALASGLYLNPTQRHLLALNLERARVLPSTSGRYVIVNAPAARLYMYENGQVVDSMRVVAGRPDPIAQTPMMVAYMRYIALNPYWNSPADITAKKLAPTILKEGRAYFKNRGYELLSDWSDHARVIDPMSIDWRAVQAGRVQARLRQKPGPANSMGKMKFMFPNAQGIWLHDTPEKEKIEDAARLQSNGCVRLEDAPRFARWLFYGRPPSPKGAHPEQKVNLPAPVPIYLTYLTAVPSGTSIVYFDDFYGKDQVQPGRTRRGGLFGIGR